MSSEVCDYHVTLVADMAVIKTDIKYIKDKVCSHVHEGEEPGGWRAQRQHMRPGARSGEAAPQASWRRTE